MTGETRMKVNKLNSIDIAIDTWDDIFSDFDPRPYSQKILSEDFINELQKRYRENPRSDMRITIFIPRSLDDKKTQNLIVSRLKQDFHIRYQQRNGAIRRIRMRGGIFVSTGIIFLGFLTWATYVRALPALTLELISIILMPLGWFGIWEGFSKIVDTSPIYFQEEMFLQRLSQATYRFKVSSEEKKSLFNIPMPRLPFWRRS